MNIQALMKQAQNLQKDMLKAKEEIDNTIFVGKSSIVTVTSNGKKEIIDVKIENESLNGDDIEILQEMIIVAINDAFKQIDKITEEKMGKYTNAMPGIF